MEHLTVIDFFCGAGGFSEGFRQQGYDIKAGYDNWQPAIDSFNHNFNTNSKVKNILDFKESTEDIDLLPDTDVIIGSPPCVSFSSSNISGKADKESGVLLTKIFLKIVAVKKFQKNSTLKAWFMENVANSRNYLADYYTFNDLGLRDWAKKNKLSPKKRAIILKNNQPLINSANYGSYQARKRAISGEIIKRKKLIIPQETHSQKQLNGLIEWNTLDDLLKKMPSPKQEKSNKKLIDPIYPEIKIPLSELTDHFYDSGLYRSEWRQSKYLKKNHPYMGKMSFPENLNKPSRTVTATKSGTSREALIYKSEFSRKGNGEFRSPTIREIASIMGFPYTYQFLGSANNKWRLVGNAVCPSVSRSLALQLKQELGLPVEQKLKLIKKTDIEGVFNLNTFSEKKFNKQPTRVKNSRFRRHPFKYGNLTVSLSNYDIDKNSKTKKKWFTSIQYGTGEGFPVQNIDDDYYNVIEPIIENYECGKTFIENIDNDFANQIGSSKELQKMYEKQLSKHPFVEPTELIVAVKDIIETLNVKENSFVQNEDIIFENKNTIPVKQLFALYAINKISSIANRR